MNLNENKGQSKKIKNVVNFKNYIAQKIDSNQKIKRYCRYLTLYPTNGTSADYDSNIKKQPDITDSLIEDFDNKELSHIIPYALMGDEPALDEKVNIFVHNFKNDFDYVTNSTTIMVDIVCPNMYNRLPFGEERIYKIAELIFDEIDSQYVDEDYIDEIGAYLFSIKGTGKSWTMNNNKLVCYSFPIVISHIGKR